MIEVVFRLQMHHCCKYNEKSLIHIDFSIQIMPFKEKTLIFFFSIRE